jgi:hypothetical protein
MQAIHTQVVLTQSHGYKHVVVAQLAGLQLPPISSNSLHISNNFLPFRSMTLYLITTYSIMAKYGFRLLPNFIDEIALDNPDLEFVEIPKSVDIDEGFHKITFGNLARSIDKCAWWIHKQLGKGHDFPALAYIGPHDLRYLFLVFGACKAGYKVCPLSYLL